VICTGKTVSEHVRALLDVTMVETGSIGLIDWWIGFADLDGRRISVAGWNRPLHRATGLGTVGEHRLGTLLRQRVRVWGFQALHRAVPGR
jgi:hypothetical protein